MSQNNTPQSPFGSQNALNLFQLLLRYVEPVHRMSG